MSAATATWFNGEPSDEQASRGLHYGDGVFRTMLLHDGAIVDLERQIATLSHDAKRLKLDVPGDLEEQLALAVSEEDGGAKGIVKILLVRASAARGYRPQTDTADCIIARYPLLPLDPRCWREGITAFRSPVVLSAQPLLAGVKHLNRLEQVLASRDWPAEGDEAVMCDEQGSPICGSRSNLFCFAGGVLHTPALERCGVAGMMRSKIIDEARSSGMKVVIGNLSWQDFEDADEAFVSNSVIGIWPLRRLGRQQWLAPGPSTQGLMRRLSHPTLWS